MGWRPGPDETGRGGEANADTIDRSRKELHPRLPRSSFTLLILVLLAGSASAQLPRARLDRIQPLGGAAGSTVELHVQGKDLEDATLRFDRPGFKAERLKADRFHVFVPTDAVPGTVEVRTVGPHGISGSRLFHVQRGLAEVTEKEPNDTAATAQKVPGECVINGTSDGEGDDYYRFFVRKGRRLTIDCLALRLDSTLRATLVLSDADGKELARSRPYHQRTDPLLDFVAPADGDYVLQLHDATYAGGLPYRLVISSRPHVENVFPLAFEPGTTSRLALVGRNLPRARVYPGGKLLDRDLDLLEVSFVSPKRDLLSLQRFDFLVHPSAPSVKMRGWQIFPAGLDDALTPVSLVHADAPVSLEKEGNDTRETAQVLKLPTVLCGRFDRPGDADWYRLDLKAGEEILVDLLCERLDLPGDPFVIVTDARGNELTQLDDHGINFNALALYNRDPVGTFRAPTAGIYYLLVQERYRQGGPRHQYVVRLRKAEPDFFPVVFPDTNPEPTATLVRQGGSAWMELCLNRRALRGGVVVEVKGLPPGVTCPPVHVSPQTEFANLVFTASPDVRDWSGTIRLEATATVEGRSFVREPRPVQRRWNIANVSSSRVCREVCLAVRPGAPYGLRLPERATTVAGSPVEVKVTVERRGAFKGKIQIVGLNLPPGFSLATSEIAEGRNDVTVKLGVASNVPPGTYSIAFRGDAQVPFSKDVKATSRPNVRVADPSTPLTLTVTPGKK